MNQVKPKKNPKRWRNNQQNKKEIHWSGASTPEPEQHQDYLQLLPCIFFNSSLETKIQFTVLMHIISNVQSHILLPSHILKLINLDYYILGTTGF